MSVSSNSLIESIGVYLPEKSVTTDEIIQGCAKPLRFPLKEMTGIDSRRMAGETEFSIDLARKAVRNCMAHSQHAPDEIDLVVCAHISRYDAPQTVTYEPSTAMVLKRDLGFSRALAFDVTNACAGMFTAIVIVHDLIRTGRIRRGLIASGEYITHLTRTAQQEIDGYLDPQLASLTLGDAGAAIILEPAPSNDVGFHVIDLYTLAQYCPLCIAKPSDGKGGASMATDSIRATAAVVEHTTKMAAHVLRKSPKPLDTFQHVIPHQTSTTSIHEGLSEVARLFGRNLEALVINNVAQRGNTASNSHFVAVKNHIENNTIKPGDGAMFCFSGSGITVGTALYTFDDLPYRLAVEPTDSTGTTESAGAAPSEPVFVEFDDTERLRIESVGTAEAGPNAADRQTQAMIVKAAKACLRESSHRRRDVGLLIHVGIYRSEFITEPAIATLAANDLKINLESDPGDEDRTLTFDLMNGSAGFLDACYVAAGMIGAGRIDQAMILASEVENNVEADDPQRRGLAEAASAVIVDRPGDSPCGFRCLLFKDYPELVDMFRAVAIAGQGPTRLDFQQQDGLVDRYVDCIKESVDELLERHGLDRQKLAVVAPPQMGTEFIDRISSALGIERARFVDAESHDLFTSSIPFGLRRARDDSRVSPGDLGLAINVGAGIHVGCGIYQF